MSFPRYPAYKDSGVEWIGEVPKHWPLPPLYLRYEVLLGKMLDAKRQTGTKSLPYLRNVDVQWDRVNTQDLPQMDVDSTELERFTLLDGDLLVCEGGEVGRTAIWRDEGVVCAFQKAIHRVRPLSSIEEPRFLFHCMQHASSQGAFIANGNPNTIPHLTGEAFRLYRFPRPPVAEQRVIAAFLDRETAKIDALVAEQRRLMDLLKEKRQAVISNAVTRGLNADALMKDSGVEWLGEVPAHWNLMPLARATVDRCDGPFGSGLKSEHYTNTGVRVIRLQNIKQDGFSDLDAAFIDATYYRESLGGHDVLAGDLLIAGLGDDNNVVGRACVAPSGIEPAMVKADCFRFRLYGHLAVPEFVAHQLNTSSAADAGVLSTGTTRSRIPLSNMGSRFIALPTRGEQESIATFVAEEMSRFGRLVGETRQATDLLKERRAALISAAVTGQIDVRGLTTPSPSDPVK